MDKKENNEVFIVQIPTEAGIVTFEGDEFKRYLELKKKQAEQEKSKMKISKPKNE